MLRHLSLDITSTCSRKLTVFLELCSQKTVCFPEQIMSPDKYLSLFSLQMEQTSQPQNTENLETETDVKKSGDFSQNLEID